MKSSDPQDVGAQLASHPGYLIRRAQQVSIALFNARFSRYGITPTQALCMHAIRSRPGIDQVAVARLIEIDHATAAMVIATLEKMDYVARNVDPNDRRRRALTITRKGVALEKKMGAFSDSGAQLLSVFKRSEAETFVALLTRFIDKHGQLLNA